MSEIILPWPNKDLSPNSRVHWAKRAKAAKSARFFARATALAAGWGGLKLPDGRVDLWIRFYPPTRRRPDDDNMLSRFKPSRDGIADALGIDDRRFVSHPYVEDEPFPNGKIVVKIQEMRHESKI